MGELYSEWPAELSKPCFGGWSDSCGTRCPQVHACLAQRLLDVRDVPADKERCLGVLRGSLWSCLMCDVGERCASVFERRRKEAQMARGLRQRWEERQGRPECFGGTCVNEGCLHLADGECAQYRSCLELRRHNERTVAGLHSGMTALEVDRVAAPTRKLGDRVNPDDPQSCERFLNYGCGDCYKRSNCDGGRHAPVACPSRIPTARRPIELSCIYCENAPDRCVVEGTKVALDMPVSGDLLLVPCVWSLRMKTEFERHAEFIKGKMRDNWWYVDPEENPLRLEDDFGGTVRRDQGGNVLRCRLCGGAFRTKRIQ